MNQLIFQRVCIDRIIEVRFKKMSTKVVQIHQISMVLEMYHTNTEDIYTPTVMTSAANLM